MPVAAQLVTAAPAAAAPPPQLPLGFALEAYPSLAGHNILVTGSGRGIGHHTAALLARLGADVYVTDLRKETIAASVRDITALNPSGRARTAPAMDLGSLASVARFAVDFQAQLGAAPLHALVNNAGANFMGVEPWFTPAGVAGIPQVNVLGPFALTQRLRRALLRAPGAARVVTVASVMHRKASLPADLDQFFTDWSGGGAYRNCKLASVLLTQELQRRWGGDGVVNSPNGCLHVGFCSAPRPPSSSLTTSAARTA